VSKRLKELERQRLWLTAQIDRQRQRLQAEGEAAGHWISVARMIAVSARRASRLYRYWNHSTQP
jgi:hypothetical protein